MKRKGLFWKIAISTIAATLLGIFIFLGVKLYHTKYGSYYSKDYIGGNCELISYFDGDVRVYNQLTRKKTTSKLDWVTVNSRNDTLAVFCKNGKRGYINLLTGKVAIVGQYDKAWIFSEGLAAVVKNKRLGFINPQGEVVIPFRFPYNQSEENKIDYVFKNGYCTAPDENGKYGLIDKQGTWKLPAEYDYIVNPVKGYRVVKKDTLFGMINSSLVLTIPVEYNWIRVTNGGLLVIKDHAQYLTSFDGKQIIQPFIYDQLNELHYTSKQVTDDGTDITIRSDYTSFEMHGLWGLMDNNGKVVIPARYSEIQAITNNLFTCKLGAGWITLSSKGERVY